MSERYKVFVVGLPGGLVVVDVSRDAAMGLYLDARESGNRNKSFSGGAMGMKVYNYDRAPKIFGAALDSFKNSSPS